MAEGTRIEAVLDAERAMFTVLALTVSGNRARTHDDFLDLMTASFGEGRLSLRNLADDLGFGFSTVARWRGGRSAPHPSLWPRIEEWIIKQALLRGQDVRTRT